MGTNIETIEGQRKYLIKSSVITVVREASEPSPKHLKTAEAVALLAREMIPDDEREHFGIFILNTRLDVLKYHEVSIGTVNASLVHPREIFSPLILFKAAGFVCVHNHPAGDPTPSAEDNAVTNRIKECADLFAIQMCDHVIFCHGSERFYSYKDNGLLESKRI